MKAGWKLEKLGSTVTPTGTEQAEYPDQVLDVVQPTLVFDAERGDPRKGFLYTEGRLVAFADDVPQQSNWGPYLAGANTALDDAMTEKDEKAEKLAKIISFIENKLGE